MTNNEMIVHNVNQETGEILPMERIIQETPEYRIVQTPDGKFKKNMKYHQYFSRIAETEEEKIELYKVFNDSESNLVTPLRNMVGKELTVAHLFFQPYDSFDEDTGNITSGVTTTIQDPEGAYFATSSKSVYYTLKNIMETFGSPDQEDYKPLKVKVTGTKRQNGVQIDLELIGRVN